MNKVAVRNDCKWILLIQQLPLEPVSLRVKIWRRLQNIGALALKNSVYMLPFTKEAYEDFQWLRDVGHASGPILAGLLLVHLEFKHVFAIIGSILIFASFVFLLFVHEERIKVAWSTGKI